MARCEIITCDICGKVSPDEHKLYIANNWYVLIGLYDTRQNRGIHSGMMETIVCDTCAKERILKVANERKDL